jgi:hypothetical protein
MGGLAAAAAFVLAFNRAKALVHALRTSSLWS